MFRMRLALSLLPLAVLAFGETGYSQLTSTELEMKEVVVTATRHEQEILKVPSHITVITQEEIQNSNAAHLGDLLRSEAGLWTVNTSGSSPTGIFIDGRGFNNGGGNGSRILVLIDGRRMNLVDTSHPDWSTIPIESIERIEIVRGSSTAVYGDNAMAGVINIMTKKGAGGPSLKLSSDWRHFDCSPDRKGHKRFRSECWNRDAGLSGTDGALSYYLYGGYESTDGFRENSDYRASHYIGKFDHKTSPFTTLHLRSSYLSSERQLPGSLTREEMEIVGRDGTVTGARPSSIWVLILFYLRFNGWRSWEDKPFEAMDFELPTPASLFSNRKTKPDPPE
jgi:iron complex outermembrane recepter protein